MLYYDKMCYMQSLFLNFLVIFLHHIIFILSFGVVKNKQTS